MLTPATDDQDRLSFSSASELLRYSLSSAKLPHTEAKKFSGYYRSWGEFNSPRMRYWYDFQVQQIERLIEKKDGMRVLDAGCGSGTESLWFSYKGADVTAIDIDDRFLDVARARLKDLQSQTSRTLNCRFERKPITHMTGAFDIIWLEHSFHHMEPRDQVVETLSALLAPGGHLVFCETNAWNPLLQWQFFRLRGRETIIEHQGEIWGHERVLTPGKLSKHLKKVGLEVVTQNYYRIFPSNPWYERTLTFERMAQKSRLAWILAPLFTHYEMVAKKPE